MEKEIHPSIKRLESLLANDLHWSKADFQRRIGIGSQVYNNWRTRGIPGNSLLEVAKLIGCSADWLKSGEGPMREEATREFPPGYATVEPGPPICARVPLISWVQAGNWSEIVETFEPGDAEEWYPTTARVGPHAFALRVHGDSMANPHGKPSIPEDSIVIVDPDVQPDSGKIVVVRLEGSNEATIKKLVIDGPQRYLKPLNPAYPIIEIGSTCTICGVVRQVVFDF